jgi:hypothetical protein
MTDTFLPFRTVSVRHALDDGHFLLFHTVSVRHGFDDGHLSMQIKNTGSIVMPPASWYNGVPRNNSDSSS